MAYFMMGTTAQSKTLKKSTAQVPQMKEIRPVATPKGGGKGRGSQTPGTEHKAVRENEKEKEKKKFCLPKSNLLTIGSPFHP